MAIPWGEIATGSMAGFAIGWRIVDSIKEKRATKRYGLKENPTRCGAHEVAIAEIKTEISNMKDDIKEIKERLK